MQLRFYGVTVVATVAALLCSTTTGWTGNEPILDPAMGKYVPLLVENFDNTIYLPGATRNANCVATASEIVQRFTSNGGSSEAVFQQPSFAFYKVIDSKGEHIVVQCNQNGSLVVGWLTTGPLADFVASSAAIGISLREKEIDAQGNNPGSGSPPPTIIINNGNKDQGASN